MTPMSETSIPGLSAIFGAAPVARLHHRLRFCFMRGVCPMPSAFGL